MSPLDATKHVPAQGLIQMFALCAIVEIFELTHTKSRQMAVDERPAFNPAVSRETSAGTPS